MTGEHASMHAGMAVLLLAALLLGPGTAAAIPLGTPVEFSSAENERKYQKLIRELRCTVCQSESLHESNAQLAADMRRRIHEMLEAGASEDEVVDFLVQRYGEYVRYRPPFQANTALLWLAPFLMLAAGAAIWLGVVRRRRRMLDHETLTEDDREALKRFRRGE